MVKKCKFYTLRASPPALSCSTLFLMVEVPKLGPIGGQIGAKLGPRWGQVGGQEAPKCSGKPGASKKVGGPLRWSRFLAHVGP